jgi:hypothetical protein
MPSATTWTPHDDQPAPVDAMRVAGQLPMFTGTGPQMTVSQVANFLNRSRERVRQWADMWASDPTKGLPHMRVPYGKRDRIFAADDVEAFKRRLLDQEEARIELLLSWRIPTAAKRA